MTQRTADAFTGFGIVAICAAAAWLYSSTGIAVAIGAILGVTVAVIAAWLRVRPLASLAVTAGSAVGALVGQRIVRVLCLPSECPGLEAVAAILTGIGALVGIGLVVALVIRSFDEYRTASAPPPDNDSAAST